MDNSTGNGTHWTCLINLNNTIIYFDSYGGPPPMSVLDKTKKYKRRFHNSIQIQQFNSNVCGYYCIYVITELLCNHKSFVDIITSFSNNMNENDQFITNYFTQQLIKSNTKTNNVSGSGIIQNVWNYLSSSDGTRNEFPPAVRQIIATIGDKRIVKMWVCRQPIVYMLRLLMNVLSLGMLEQQLKRFNYDNLFHLYLVIQLDGNLPLYRLEKNHVINLNIYKAPNNGVECKDVQIFGNKTLNEFLLKGIETNPNFFKYDSINSNCQLFVYDLLKSNNYNTDFEFIKQNVKTLIPSYLQRFNLGITNIASKLDVLINGRGI